MYDGTIVLNSTENKITRTLILLQARIILDTPRNNGPDPLRVSDKGAACTQAEISSPASIFRFSRVLVQVDQRKRPAASFISVIYSSGRPRGRQDDGGSVGGALTAFQLFR